VPVRSTPPDSDSGFDGSNLILSVTPIVIASTLVFFAEFANVSPTHCDYSMHRREIRVLVTELGK